jgi:L-malate glycosyltransferase
MTWTLLSQLAKRPDVEVLALSLNEGELTAALRASGVETQVVLESERTFFDLVRQAETAFQGRGIDVIHAHRNKENLLAWCIRKRLGAKSLMTTLHGLSEVSRRWNLARVRRYMVERIDDGLLRRAFDSVVAVSEDIQRTLLESRGYSHTKVSVIHNGIDLPEWTVRPKRSFIPFRIGAVGRFVPVKDFPLFIAVGKALVKAGEAVHLVLLGEGPQKEELQAMVRREGLDAVVSFAAPCADPTSFYRSLDLYLNTSKHEGIPLSVLEAMACGVPVVAPAVGGIPEILRDREEGLLVATRTATEFAEACRQVIHDREGYGRMGQRARARIESEFSSEKMAASYLALYRTLVDCNTYL